MTCSRAPEVDRPRELMEDSLGTIWIASNSRGLTHFPPGGKSVSITSSNGLAHTSISCLTQDKEGNIWAGGSTAGLCRLKARQFVTIGMAEGLLDNTVRSVTECARLLPIPGSASVGVCCGTNRGVFGPAPLATDFWLKQMAYYSLFRCLTPWALPLTA